MAAVPARAPADTKEANLPPHRCVVMVEDVGQASRGSTLRAVGEPLVEFVTQCLSVDGQSEVAIDPAPESREGAWSLVRFARPDVEHGDPSEERLWLREAWLPDGHLTPNYRAVVMGILPMWWAQLSSVLRAVRHEVGVGRVWQAPSPVDPAYASPESSLTTRIYELILGLSLATLFTLGLPVVFAAVLLAWILQGAPGLLGLPGSSRAAAQLLDRFSLCQLGGLQYYFSTHQFRVSIREAVEAAITPSLAPGHGRTCQGVTVIAHSWQCVVALDALSSLARRTDLEHPRVTLLTVGSALNRAWRLRPRDPLWQRVREMRGWLTKIRWVNVWSRHDPVCAGPLDQRLWDHLNRCGAMVYERRVVTSEDPTADHGSYWTNRTEVQTLIAHEVLGHPRPSDRAIRERQAARTERRRWVCDLIAFRLLVIGWAAVLGLALPTADLETVRWSALLLLSALGLVVLNTVPIAFRAIATGIALVCMFLGGALVVATNGALTAWGGERFDALPLAVRVLVDLVLLVGLHKAITQLVLGPKLEDPIAVLARPAPVVEKRRFAFRIVERSSSLTAAIATRRDRAAMRLRAALGALRERPRALACAVTDEVHSLLSIASVRTESWLDALGQRVEAGIRTPADWASSLSRRIGGWRQKEPASDAV